MKIAILEDQYRFVHSITEALPKKHEIAHIAPPVSVDECVKAINDFAPDVLLLDHDLDRGYTGEEVLSSIDQSKINVIGISSDRQKYTAKHFSFKDYLPKFGDELVDLL